MPRLHIPSAREVTRGLMARDLRFCLDRKPIKMKKITPNFGFRGILISKSPIDLYAIYN